MDRRQDPVHLTGHGREQLPGDDVAREVVEHRRQVGPAPADDLEVGEEPVDVPGRVGQEDVVVTNDGPHSFRFE